MDHRLILCLFILLFGIKESALRHLGQSTSTAATTTTTRIDNNSRNESGSEGQRDPGIASLSYVSNCVDFSLDNVSVSLLQQMRIEAIKREILMTLRMTHVPDPSKLNATVLELRQIIRLYRKSLEAIHGKMSTVLFDNDQFYANQFYSFVDRGEMPPGLAGRTWNVEGRLRFYFPVDIPEPSDAHRETVVKSATLKLFKWEVFPENLVNSDMVDRSVRMEIFQIVSSGPDQLLRRSIYSKLVSLENNSSWEEFDVSQAVQDWIRNPASNFGLEIACDSRYRPGDLMNFSVSTMRDGANNLHGPLPTLNVLTQERRILSGNLGRRQKRSSVHGRYGDCVRGGSERRCCRYPWTVSFRDIGWDSWVVEPLEYQAYYCAGTCPSGHRVAHRFTNVKSILIQMNPGLILPVKCSPTRLLPLSIAHYNKDGALIVSVLEDMIADECMCV